MKTLLTLALALLLQMVVNHINFHRIWTARTLAIIRFPALLLALTLAAHYNPLGPKTGSERSLNNVVVAKVDIPVGSRLVPEDLEVAQFPPKVTPAGAISKIDDKLVGRVVLTSLEPREPVTEMCLAPERAARGNSSTIPEGYREMTVMVDDVTGVSGFIQPGTLVDVVVVINPPKGSGNDERISKIVLQNIKVLPIRQNIDNHREPDHGVRAFTLQVTSEQAEKLATASSEGKLQVVTRKSMIGRMSRPLA